MAAFEHLLAPGRIGTLGLRNRILMAPMGEELAELDGTVGDRQLAYVEARAAGGAALVSLGSVAIAWPAGTANECQNGISDDRFEAGIRRLADAAHAHGAALALQLTHMGKVARNDIVAGRPMQVPSVPGRPGFDPLMAMITADELEASIAPMQAPTAKVEFHEMTPDDIAVVWRSLPMPRHAPRRGASTRWSCTPATAISSTSSCRPPRTIAPTTTAARSRRAPASCSR